MKQNKIQKTEKNIESANRILELITDAPDAVKPHNPVIMFCPETGRLYLGSNLIDNGSDIELIDLSGGYDALGDGWTTDDAELLIDFLNDNCEFEVESNS